MSFWEELRRRNVAKVGAAYLVFAWLLAQVAGFFAPALNLPEWSLTFVAFVLILGFPLALFLAWAYEVTPEGIKQTRDVSSENGVSGNGSRRLNVVLVVLFALAVGFIGFDRLLARPDSLASDSGMAVRRVAIMPCADSSPDTSGQFFAVGIHAELINKLRSLQGLEVISQSSVMLYENTRQSIPEIAAALNVDAVMECAARYSGDQVVLTASLIDGRTDANLWSDRYPANLSEIGVIFEIQADIAMNVANALLVEFLAGELGRLEQQPTSSREAYELYLAANAARQPGTDDGMERAIDLLDRALAIDPMYVQAWTLLSSLKTIVASSSSVELDQAIAAAERAIELAPGNGDGYAQLGFALGQRFEWTVAEAAYQRALELGWPLGNMPQYSTQQLAVGHIAQAIETLESNLETDPMNPIALGFLMTAYDIRGDVAKADELYERGRTLHGDWPWGITLSIPLRLGRGDIEFLQSELRPFAQGIDAEMLDVINDPNDAREVLVRYESDPEEFVAVAMWAAYLGDVDLAMESLQEAARSSGLDMRASWQPLFREVRRMPEFQDLLDELGVVEYWNETEWPEFCQQSDDVEVVCQ